MAIRAPSLYVRQRSFNRPSKTNGGGDLDLDGFKASKLQSFTDSFNPLLFCEALKP
jgi:hypothetical protein